MAFYHTFVFFSGDKSWILMIFVFYKFEQYGAVTSNVLGTLGLGVGMGSTAGIYFLFLFCYSLNKDVTKQHLYDAVFLWILPEEQFFFFIFIVSLNVRWTICFSNELVLDPPHLTLRLYQQNGGVTWNTDAAPLPIHFIGKWCRAPSQALRGSYLSRRRHQACVWSGEAEIHIWWKRIWTSVGKVTQAGKQRGHDGRSVCQHVSVCEKEREREGESERAYITAVNAWLYK